MFSSWNRRGVALLVGVVLLATAAWFLRPASGWDRDDSLQRVQRAGVLRAGYSVGAPYATVDGSGEPRGLAVDAIKGIAAALGVPRVEWVQTSYSQLIPELLDQRFDVVSLQLVISPDRQAQVAFSRPAAIVRYGVLVAHGNPRGVPGYSQLSPESGVIVAVTRGTPAVIELRRRGFTDGQLQLVSEGESGEATLRAGAAHALIRLEATLKLIASDHPGEFSFVEDADTTERSTLTLGYAFRPADEGLRQAWDEVLLQTGQAKDGAP